MPRSHGSERTGTADDTHTKESGGRGGETSGRQWQRGDKEKGNIRSLQQHSASERVASGAAKAAFLHQPVAIVRWYLSFSRFPLRCETAELLGCVGDSAFPALNQQFV